MNVQAFLQTLPYMGRGMLGIFVVTLVLMLCVETLSRLPAPRKKRGE